VDPNSAYVVVVAGETVMEGAVEMIAEGARLSAHAWLEVFQPVKIRVHVPSRSALGSFAIALWRRRAKHGPWFLSLSAQRLSGAVEDPGRFRMHS